MKTMLELEHGECRFALNEGDPEYIFCGKPTHFVLPKTDGIVRQSSYCREHHLICTVVPTTKRVAA